MNLPTEFVARMQAIVPPEHLDTVLESFLTEKALTVWENPLKAHKNNAFQALTDAGATLELLDLTPSHSTINGRAAVVKGLPREVLTQGALSHLLESGSLYLINPSSLLPPAALNPEPNQQVLDLCAAPGGKSVQLAARVFVDPERQSGYFAAVEAIKPRFFKLKAMLERYGAPKDPARLRLFLKDGRHVGSAVPERFDRVLIDAPCSSEARFDATDADSYAHWKPRKLAECAYKQKGLLRSGLEALKVGGELVYCTCSFAPEENEEVVKAILVELGDAVELLSTHFPTSVPSMPGLELPEAIRILPNRIWDGFFLVRMKKNASITGKN